MLCPEELAATVTAAAIGLSKGRSDEEIGVLAAVFTQIGDTLATIAAQRAAIEACCEEKCPPRTSKSDNGKEKFPFANINGIA